MYLIPDAFSNIVNVQHTFMAFHDIKYHHHKNNNYPPYFCIDYSRIVQIVYRKQQLLRNIDSLDLFRFCFAFEFSVHKIRIKCEIQN